MAADRIPASEIGMTICTMARAGLQPSTMAAASMSLEIDLKNPMSSHTQNGMVNEGYTSTSAPSVSCSPSPATMRDIGMNSSVGGHQVGEEDRDAEPLAPPPAQRGQR